MFQWTLSVCFVFFLVSAVNAGSFPQPTQHGIIPQAQVTEPSSNTNTPQPIGEKPHMTMPQVAKADVVKTECVITDAPQPVAAKPQSAQPKVDKPATESTLVAQTGKAPAVPTPVPQDVRSIVELLPHRATYSVTLDKNHFEDKNYADEDIENAHGQMTIQQAKAGDGWAIEQKLTLHIYYKDGTAEQVITSLATYESMDGLKYNFNARTLRGDVEEIISGDAILASKGGAGIVTYQQPDESTVQLPVGTIFPTQHLTYVLEAAAKGQKVVSNIVFDGSSETHEPVQVNTILGASQEPKLALTNKDLLQFKRVWPMRMAIYAVDSPAAEPDYEINQNVLDRGVIRDMMLDYGTFKVKAVLIEVVVFS